MDYHMTDIIPLLPIPQPPYGKVSYNIPCPKCQSGSQHRKGRLNINLKKDVFRCPKCGQFEGGVFDLYAYYMGISRDDVRKELEKRFGRNGSSGSGKKSKRTHRQLPPPPDIPQAQLADIETRHRVYSALLNHLTLASDHKQNLLDRGLTEEAIFKFQYRTTPLVGHETIAKTLDSLGYALADIQQSSGSVVSLAAQMAYQSILRATATLLAIIPLLVLYVFCQKFFIQSVERTGIVG